MKKSSLAVSFCIPLFCLPVYADVDYFIDVNDPLHHLAQVKIQFPETRSTALMLNLPVWRTGKYQVLPLANNIRLLTAMNEQGETLPVNRLASGEWQVSLSKPTSVTVSYQLHADLLGQRVNHISSTHAFLDASGTFMYSPEFREDKINVNLSVPANWHSYSGMDKGQGEHRFTAANYDVLVDSPIESGINQYREFTVDDKQYEIVVWGEGNYNLQKMVTDLAKLSRQAQIIWDGYPFSRYVYMIHATSGESGATEHLNSTIIQKPRFNFSEREDYLSFMKTAAHEFIHTWNVKAYRPKGLVPYDYQNEKLSELLWIAEGSTSYFQSQLLLSAGVITAEEFFDDLAKRIALSQMTPGNKVQSVAEASLNQWVSTGDDYAVNNSVNIYSEGYLTSLALDFSLLESTSMAVSYRDVHGQLYQDYALPNSYDVDDVKNILKTLSGQDYQAWWSKYVESPVQLDFSQLLGRAGLTLSHGEDIKMVPSAGIVFDDGSLILTQVLRDGPGWNAGLAVGDEILAVNGLKTTVDGIEKRLNDFKVGDAIKLTVFHEDKLKSVEVILTEQLKEPLALMSVTSPTLGQKAFLKAWLGIQWPFDDKGDWIKP